MPQTIGWIDALKRWNAGSPSWCIPRKGTAGYDSIMRIRRGEPEKSVRERIEEIEAKSPKQKKERKTIKIKLTAEPSVENNVDKTQQKKMEVSKTNEGSPRGVKAMEVIDTTPITAPLETMNYNERMEHIRKQIERLHDLAVKGVLYATTIVGARVGQYGEEFYYVRQGDTLIKIAKVGTRLSATKIPLVNKFEFMNIRKQSYPFASKEAYQVDRRVFEEKK